MATKPFAPHNSLSGDGQFVVVSRKDLERLCKEARQMKEVVSQVVTPEYVQALGQMTSLRNELERAGQQIQQLGSERDHWQARCEATLADVEALKQEKLALRCELQESSQQMSQQSEYCANLGAASCTLLWRVSRCEETIQTILAGSKVDEFLSMVSSTLESYLHTYKEDIPQELADETQFVMALCGIITNIAASAVGRDFLMSNVSGVALVDTLVTVLAEAPNKTCAKMKSLVLMALYNLSINQKGLKHISSKTGVLSLLAWIIQGVSAKDTRLNSVRLAQSLLYEQTNPAVQHEAQEVFTSLFLQQLSEDSCVEVREAALELVQDLQTMKHEQ